MFTSIVDNFNKGSKILCGKLTTIRWLSSIQHIWYVLCETDFRFVIASTNELDLTVRVEDEFTYFADGKPLLEGATIVLQSRLRDVTMSKVTNASGRGGGRATRCYQVTNIKLIWRMRHVLVIIQITFVIITLRYVLIIMFTFVLIIIITLCPTYNNDYFRCHNNN